MSLIEQAMGDIIALYYNDVLFTIALGLVMVLVYVRTTKARGDPK